MAYIISVNASILADSGGPCDPALATSSVQSDVDAYNACTAEVQKELITATAASAALASVLMGVFANIPVGLAPGLGLNAYVSSSSLNSNLRCLCWRFSALEDMF